MGLLMVCMLAVFAVSGCETSKKETTDDEKVESVEQEDAVQEETEQTDVEEDEPEEGSEEEQVGLANPASVYCNEQGGELYPVETEEGTAGYCKLPDGRICDEWALFNSQGEDCVILEEATDGDEDTGEDAEVPAAQGTVYAEVLSDLTDEIGFDQITLQDANFLWNVLEEGEIVETELWGASVSAMDRDTAFVQRTHTYFTDNGFIADQYNVADGTSEGITGYMKGSLVCLVHVIGMENAKVEVSCAELI